MVGSAPGAVVIVALGAVWVLASVATLAARQLGRNMVVPRTVVRAVVVNPLKSCWFIVVLLVFAAAIGSD
jgi:hypothetical protein